MRKLLFFVAVAFSLMGCPGDEPGPPSTPPPMLDMPDDVVPDVEPDEPIDEPSLKARPRMVWSGGSGAIETTKHQGQLMIGPLTTIRR